MRHTRRLFAAVAALCVPMLVMPDARAAAFAPAMPGPLAELQERLDAVALTAPGRVALAVADPVSGLVTGVNMNVEMPAASTIKVPVMVEVFRRLAGGDFDLNTRVTLRAADKDWGSGDLCDAPAGTAYPVSQLLSVMIDDSDNTATNMLIRLVGRQNINATMLRLGLTHTRLNDFIRSNGPIRWALRSTPADMTKLLLTMEREKLIDEWSSRQMIAIMAADHINTLLPVPLPPGTTIAHKTGSLRDTLNDVGIVYPQSGQTPYVIAVMTTGLRSLESGRQFIRGVSKLAYATFDAFNDREPLPAAAAESAPLLTAPTPAPAPDVKMWTPPEAQPTTAAPGDAGTPG